VRRSGIESAGRHLARFRDAAPRTQLLPLHTVTVSAIQEDPPVGINLYIPEAAQAVCTDKVVARFSCFVCHPDSSNQFPRSASKPLACCHVPAGNVFPRSSLVFFDPVRHYLFLRFCLQQLSAVPIVLPQWRCLGIWPLLFTFSSLVLFRP